MSGFLIGNHGRRKEYSNFQVLDGKNCRCRILYPVKLSFRNEREIKQLSEEEKLREFITSRTS